MIFSFKVPLVFCHAVTVTDDHVGTWWWWRDGGAGGAGWVVVKDGDGCEGW